MPPPTLAEYTRGALYGLAAVSIWAGWMVVARLGLKTSLTPWDIAALRFAVAGPILLPFLLRRGLARDRLGWTGLLLIMIGGGAPMALLANTGLSFAPAAHAGALFPGTMPLMVAIVATFVLHEAFTRAKTIGFVLVLAGVLAIVWNAGGTIGTRENLGHLMFLGAALLWALYTVAMRRAQLTGLHAAAIAAVASMVLYLPVFVLFGESRLVSAPLSDIVVQAVVQGILTAIVSLLLYGRAVTILGASSGAAFAALCPAMTALLAIPLLDEFPAGLDWTAIALVSAGVYFVSGGPLPGRAKRGGHLM